MIESDTETPGAGNLVEVEIKDAQVIFTSVWKGLVDDFGLDHLRFPKEIILLGGAPGSGKGTNTAFIMKARGFTCPPIIVSSLLDSPEARALKDNGMLVGDREVMGILLRKMLEPEFRDGAILDGFPRTKVQVECMKLLVKKVAGLYRKYVDTPLASHFRRPTIHVMVLFVDEKTSVERQLYRGRQIAKHNEGVDATGIGEKQELRPTDLDVEAAKHRYRIFKESTWDALQSLREHFFYHLINAQGSLSEVEQNIINELKYQSSLELDPATFEIVRGIPLANEIVVHARQELVRRLDGYSREHRDLFKRVVELIHVKFIPIIQRHAISGRAVINNEDQILADPLALGMLIDIFSDRGYHAVVDKQLTKIPERVNVATGEIEFRPNTTYRIRVYFEGSDIRLGGL
ncbi:MAG: nucleoside monophosphate kinase [Verrucomicrobiales bacterium]|jgi:adenylate kinase|nr:nucleoside monophosphate kinase [Verrucomicrobiales bacterium]MBP9225293.1 nucleoside monophosphate kinase [Verrucomicrobiales bacterium]HQZ27085.1 nucleoside monophosphate kinase [Verrucomicrobiales bacterium]